ncbi:MAG: Rieske (2Fe-2S) protein [Hydrogenophaga sp.]|jgi:nitrite reductase/ring-hydroxylating ferredoxin subunit|nr:Rieske (2Fe-2S) protein [Hydrogenophaga sp.]
MRLCHLDELPDGSARGFDPHASGRDSLFVVRCGPVLRAWVNACPHHGTPLAWRKDAYLNAAGDRIVCAAHGAQFDIDSGLCTLGPCLGDALKPVELHVHRDGDIHLFTFENDETHS